MKKTLLFIALLLSVFAPLRVNAASASITGTTNVTAGTRFSLTFAVTNTTNLEAIQTVIDFNSNHFSMTNNITNLITNNTISEGADFNSVNRKFIDEWVGRPRSGTVQFLRIEFQTLPGFTPGTSSTISMTNTIIMQGITRTSVARRDFVVTSIAPLSTVNTLNNITINGSNLAGFSATTTSYTLPATQETSITIGAERTDSRSTLSGTGTFPLNYGNNRFVLTVRSESGSNRTYTINVPRPDLRGDDTTIKRVTIGDQTLDWNKEDITRNILLIPNSLSQTNITVVLNENTSRVTSSLNQTFNVGENNIEITVQSEKGTVQSYPLMIVRADDQNAFPAKYTSTDIEKILINDVEFLINQNVVRLPFNIDTPVVSIVPVSSLTKVEISEVGTLVFGDNLINVTLTAFDGTVTTVSINLFRENQMSPVTLAELLENIESYPIETLSFFYEGLVSDEEILNKLVASNKSFRIFVQTSSVVGYWFLSNEDTLLLKDINFNIEEDLTLEFQNNLNYIVQTNVIFKETNFTKPIPFTFTQFINLTLYDSLYGYQVTEDGLQLIDTWNVLPLNSTIEVGGPLHLVITPVLFQEGFIEVDHRYLLALIIAVAAGWLFLFISLFNNVRLKKKIKKLKKEIIK